MPFTVQEQAAPSTPATGYVTIYAKTDGLVYGKDDAGTETLLSNAGSGITLGTPQATTSGTAFDFTVTSGAKRVTIMLQGVSVSGTDDILVQIGPSSGVETSSYISTSNFSTNVASSTTGFIMRMTTASGLMSGSMVLTLMNSSTNLWVSSHSAKVNTTASIHGGGDKTISGALINIRITRTGSDTFDAGSVNISYES